MKADSFLSQYGDTCRQIEKLKEMRNDIEDGITSVGSVHYATIDGERHIVHYSHTNNLNRSIEDTALNLAEIDEMIEELNEQRARVLVDSFKVIDKVKTKNERINELVKLELYLHYIDGRTWKECAEFCDITPSLIYNHRIKALRAVDSILSADNDTSEANKES